MASKNSGGAELLVRCEPFSGAGEEIVLHLTATTPRFLELAEQFSLKKVDDRGLLREFHVRDLDAFLVNDILLETLISPAEKELIVLAEIQSIGALPGEGHIPGYPNLKLHSGQSIFQLYVEAGLISGYHPLHDEKGLDKLLETNWVEAFFANEPFEALRSYFGEAIALYFTFMGCYTYLLSLPGLATLLFAIIPDWMLSPRVEIYLVSGMNLVFITYFLKFWKRKCSELAYCWGTLRMTIWEQPRQGYRGRMALDPVTGQYQPRYPGYKTHIKVWLVSFPLVIVSMWGAYRVMLCYFMAEQILAPYKIRYAGSLLGLVFKFLGSIGYAISVAAMTYCYRMLADELTEWENHRTQTQFDRHHVAKLIAFESVNNFMSFLYIGFVLKNLELLKQQLIVMISVMHLILAVQEIVIPLLWRSTTKKLTTFLHRHSNSTNPTSPSTGSTIPDVVYQTLAGKRRSRQQHHRSPSLRHNANWISHLHHQDHDPAALGLVPLLESDPRIEMSTFEGDMDPYKGCYDDYSQLFLQFGYVFLFSPLFPQASAIAVAANVFLMYANIYKLCAVFQRPVPKRVKDIGSWQIAFELIGYLAVMTNIALLVSSAGLKQSAQRAGWTSDRFYLALIIVEHILIAGRLAVNYLVPSVPQWVRVASARTEFQAVEAYKKKQSTKTRRRLNMRFQMINPIVSKSDVNPED
ncbi:anoctamin-10 [Folsomia candida]|nr:anoctamin-10 [Folsomia candida]XP_035710332.1 anoctamin-10 [Folsomia candida]